MSSNIGRALLLAGVGLSLFGITIIGLMKALPGPHTERDYFIIGCLATLVTLFAMFLILIKTWIKGPNLLFKKRKREEETETPRRSTSGPLGLS
jgi:Na+/melibiose symporter-like transporter